MALHGLTSPFQATPSSSVAEPRDQSLTPSRQRGPPQQGLRSPIPSRASAAAAAHEIGVRDNTQAKHQSRTDFQALSSSSTTTHSSPLYSRSQPIQIPSVPVTKRDPNRVPTPLSGRGDRKGHFFPFSRTPSPVASQSPPSKRQPYFSPEAANASFGFEHRRRSSSSHSSRSYYIFSMPGEQLAARYTPSSPLSPRIPSSQRPLSPQPHRGRTTHARQSSRTMHMNLPRYHPSNFHHNDLPAGVASVQSPGMVMPRDQQQTPVESPRLMRERQRELIDRARMTQRIAASPMGIKPDAPRLDPLGSPKGPVTPLALEEAADYFQNGSVAQVSPASSPGARSDGSATKMGEGKSKKPTKADAIR